MAFPKQGGFKVNNHSSSSLAMSSVNAASPDGNANLINYGSPLASSNVCTPPVSDGARKIGNPFILEQFKMSEGVKPDESKVSFYCCNFCQEPTFKWNTFNSTRACMHIVNLCVKAPPAVKNATMTSTQSAKRDKLNVSFLSISSNGALSC
jgi:hypothetical protein